MFSNTSEFHKLQHITSAYEQTVTQLSNKIDALEKETNDKVINLQMQLDELRNAISNPSDISEMKEALNQLKSEIWEIKKSSKTHSIGNIAKHEEHINYLHSVQRLDNLVIQGVPEETNENETKLREIITKIAGICGVLLTPASIKSIHRIRQTRPKKSTNTRPNAILLRLTEGSHAKEQIFLKYLELVAAGRPLNCQMIGMSQGTRIFLNHHLSRELLQIKDKALILKREKVIQKVTPRYNTVKLQIKDKWHKIESIDILNDVIQKELNLNMETLVNRQLNIERNQGDTASSMIF